MATTTNAGQDYQVRNIAVNSTSDTAIDFDREVNSVLLQCRTSIDLYVRRNANDADYFTVFAGSVLTLDVARGDNDVCWVRSASGTPTVEAIGTF